MITGYFWVQTGCKSVQPTVAVTRLANPRVRKPCPFFGQVSPVVTFDFSELKQGTSPHFCVLHPEEELKSHHHGCLSQALISNRWVTQKTHLHHTEPSNRVCRFCVFLQSPLRRLRSTSRRASGGVCSESSRTAPRSRGRGPRNRSLSGG